MRTNGGNYTFQQALTVESSSIVKQALNLAKRRGHSHVTPLHVASTMLVSSSSAILRNACFQSHSHPLQYKALELCFNVALNRLPTSASSSPLILDSRLHPPCLSNALVAAFKRAQAHQRRGSTENQPVLVLKIEIEQLVISILDDPSVSRVMREAGFSSIVLKSNIEHTISSENSSKPIVIAQGNSLKLSLCRSNDDDTSVSRVMREVKTNVEHAISSVNSTKPIVIARNNLELSLHRSGDHDDTSVSRVMKEAGFSSIQLKTNANSTKPMVIARNNLELSLCRTADDQIKNDVMSVIEAMMNNKRNTVIIGECLANAERIVRGVIDKFDMKHVQFISVPLSTLKNVSKEEFASKIEELRIILRSYIHRGVVLYLGDLEWISEYWNDQENNYIITELSRLFCDEMRENEKLWLMGIASFSTYIRYKTGCPSLQSLWDLHPVTVPVVSLDLSLNLESDRHSHFISTTTLDGSSRLLARDEVKKEHQFLNTKPELLSNPNSSPNSASSSEASGFKELNPKLCCSNFPEILVPHQCRILQKCASATSGGLDTHLSTFSNSTSNMKILCKALEEKVPWQKDIIYDIVSTILECRHKKEETWLLFLGDDFQGKEKISKELAKMIFGSQDNFISIGLSNFSSSTRSDSTEQEVMSNKRSRDERGRSYLERFADAIQENPSRVFFMEDVDQVDSFTQKGIQKAIETGKLTLTNGDLVLIKDSIVIFNCEEYFSSISRTNIQKFGEENKENDSLDLNIFIGESRNENFVSDFGLFGGVDKQIMFKIQVL